MSIAIRNLIARALVAALLCLSLALAACGDESGGCPGVLIPSCTSANLAKCPECPPGDSGWCVGYGFEPERCCGCGDPP